MNSLDIYQNKKCMDCNDFFHIFDSNAWMGQNLKGEYVFKCGKCINNDNKNLIQEKSDEL